jgi:hypothetical protein
MNLIKEIIPTKLYKFKGQDKALLTEYEDRISNTLTACMSVDKENSPEFINKRFLKKIREHLQDEFSILRARQYDDKHYYYDDEDANTYSRKLIKISNKKLSHLQLGKILVKTNVPFLIRIYNNIIYYTANHVFLDGLNFAKLVCIGLDENPIDTSIFPNFSYIPLFTEAVILTKLIPIMINIPKRNLSYYHHWQTHRKPFLIKEYKFSLIDFTKIKRFIENLLKDNLKNGKFGFSATLTVLIALFVFKYTDKKELSIAFPMGIPNGTVSRLALTTAFQNDKTFNNFSAVLLIVKKTDNWELLSHKSKIEIISNQINDALISYAKEQSLGIYLFTNIYEFKFYTNKHADIVFATFPFKEKIVFNEKTANIDKVEMYGTSMPIYIGCFSKNGDIYMNMFSRTYDFKITTKTPFILDELLHICTDLK